MLKLEKYTPPKHEQLFIHDHLDRDQDGLLVDKFCVIVKTKTGKILKVSERRNCKLVTMPSNGRDELIESTKQWIQQNHQEARIEVLTTLKFPK